MSTCARCLTPGRLIGLWFAPLSRVKWLVFRCQNPACEFTYRGIDGRERPGSPTWKAPAEEAAATVEEKP